MKIDVRIIASYEFASIQDQAKGVNKSGTLKKRSSTPIKLQLGADIKYRRAENIYIGFPI